MWAPSAIAQQAIRAIGPAGRSSWPPTGRDCPAGQASRHGGSPGHRGKNTSCKDCCFWGTKQAVPSWGGYAHVYPSIWGESRWAGDTSPPSIVPAQRAKARHQVQGLAAPASHVTLRLVALGHNTSDHAHCYSKCPTARLSCKSMKTFVILHVNVFAEATREFNKARWSKVIISKGTRGTSVLNRTGVHAAPCWLWTTGWGREGKLLYNLEPIYPESILINKSGVQQIMVIYNIISPIKWKEVYNKDIFIAVIVSNQEMSGRVRRNL